MVGLAEEVEGIECANELEAWVREEQLIDSLQPPFNRRSRDPRRGWYVAPGAREGTVSARREPFNGSIGPFRTKAEGRDAALLIGTEHWEAVVAGEHAGGLEAAIEEIEGLAESGRFESAARRRDELAPAISALGAVHSLGPLATVDEMILAQRAGGSWTFAVIRHGRLAGAGTLPRGADLETHLGALRAAARHIEPGPGPFSGASPAEARLVARWMDTRPTRIVAVEGEWSEPARGAQRLTEWAETARTAAREARRALG